MTQVSEQKSASSGLVGFRVSGTLAARIDAVAAELKRKRGTPVTKGTVVQEAVGRGLALLVDESSTELSDAAGLAGEHQFRVHLDDDQVQRVRRRLTTGGRVVPRVFVIREALLRGLAVLEHR